MRKVGEAVGKGKGMGWAGFGEDVGGIGRE